MPPETLTSTRPDPLSATGITQDIATGKRSPLDVAEACLKRVAEWEPQVRAFAFLDPDLVRNQAQAVDITSPLAGVTVAVKDIINTKDMPTQHNTTRYRDHRPGVDAACVDTLRAAGAVILGKAVTTEFASTVRGSVTRNPLDLTRTPGGSSSGSAAAVASGMASIGLGTQTGGSTIRPASFCGIWGMKPTWSMISREGLKQYSVTCDTLGLYARAAEDLELLADVFDFDPAPQPASLQGLKIGFCRTPNWLQVEASMRDAMEEAASALRLAGADVVELELPALFDGLPAAHSVILAREGRSSFLNEVRNTPGIHEDYVGMVENRRDITPEEARRAYALADQCRAELDEILTGMDAIMTPSACGEAPEGLENTGSAAMNSMWTVLQVPVVSAPGLTGPNGMPLGVSFITRRYADRTALAVAKLAGAAFAGT